MGCGETFWGWIAGLKFSERITLKITRSQEGELGIPGTERISEYRGVRQAGGKLSENWTGLKRT